MATEAAFHKLIRLGPRPGVRAEVSRRSVKVLATVLREDDATRTGLLVLYRFDDTQEERLMPLAKWPKLKRKEDLDRFNHQCPEAGTIWRHFKGGVYGVMTSACHDLTGEQFIVYQCEQTATRWARLLTSWQAPTPEGQPRFVRVR